MMSFVCFSINAQTATWTGPATGDWSTGANWSTAAAPLATDSVSIPTGSEVTISSDAGIINRLNVSGKLIIGASGSLTVDQSASPNGAGIVNLVGGEITNNGVLTIKNTVAAASNTVIQFSDNADRDNKLTNNGIFTMDNTIGAYASTTGRVIGLSMVSPGRTSTFKFGGTMDFIVKPIGCLIETNGGGNLTLDGTLVLGSSTDYRNLRFIKIQAGGNVTVAATADITVYTGFVSGNGVINMQSAITTAPGSTFTNYGKIAIHGGPATTGYGIYFNPQAATALNTFTNAGTISVDGTFPLGFMYIGGNSTGTTTINNTGTLSLYSIDPALQVVKTAGTGNTVTIVNDGTLNVSSADITLTSTAAVFTNNGAVNYNYVAGIKQLTDFNGKVYSNGNEITVNLPANENAQFILSDITGRTLKTANVQGENNTFTMSNLKGIFIVRLLTAKGSYSQKISLN